MAEKKEVAIEEGKAAAPAAKEVKKVEVKTKSKAAKAEAETEAAPEDKAAKSTAAAKKTTAKKTTTKKTTTKKTTAKKTEEPKKAEEPKRAPSIPTAVKNAGVFVQYNHKENELNALKERIVEHWCSTENKKPSAIKEMSIYIKPEDNAAYYVINGQGSSIEL